MKRVTNNKNGQVVVETVTVGDSLTQQQFAEQTDINNIMRKFQQTGQLYQNPQTPLYADISEVGDYHSALQKVLDANDAFMKLDPNVRARFSNDPGQFVEFISDSKNRKEAEELGLVIKKELAVSNDDDKTTTNSTANAT